MSLKQKTISGLFWSFSDDMLKHMVHFIVGIILARLITPAEFGLIGIYIGIHAMIVGMVFNSIVSYFINSYYSGRMISYPVREQIRDIAPSFIIAVSASAFIYVYSLFIDIHPFLLLASQGLIGLTLIILFSELSRQEGYVEIKGIFVEKLGKIFRYGQKRK